ncbi:MAG: hypothetical protein ACKO96_18645 [Flammeovirgaceae bacterium]
MQKEKIMERKLIIESAAIVVRKQWDQLVIVGSSCLPSVDIDESEHLFLGKLTFEYSHGFKGYKIAPGNTPNELLLGGGMDFRNYETKI